MSVDTVEELRAELRGCLFSQAERQALEAELAELVRRCNEASVPRDEELLADQTFSTAGA